MSSPQTMVTSVLSRLVIFSFLGCSIAFRAQTSNLLKPSSINCRINGYKAQTSRVMPKLMSTTIESTDVLSASTLSEVPSKTPNNQDNIDSQYELSPQQFVYVVLTSIFVTCLIIADVIGVKLFDIPLPFEIFGRTSVEHVSLF